MAKRLNGTGTPRGKGRPLAAGALSGIWLATLGWAAIDLQDEQVRSSERLSEDLFRAADVVERLFQADQRDIDGVLARLRTELRAKNVWNVTPPEAKARDELAELTKTGRRDGEEIDDRRLEAVLRRAFEGSDRLASLEVVVAGHAGLTVVGVERTNEGPRRIQRAREERDGIAKALWYAEEVSRAVASAGRRVERGEIGFEGEIERPLARAVIGLHEPGELEQGVLVASIDPSGLAEFFSAAMASGQNLSLLAVDGRPLDPTISDPETRSRLSSLTMRVFSADGAIAPFEADGQWILGRPLATAENGPASSLVLIEAPAPASGFDAWFSSPWMPGMVVCSLSTWIAIGLLLFGARGATNRQSGRETKMGEQVSGVGVQDEIQLAHESVILRDWLADIRGCLEREAATRGLGLELRCDRSMPEDFSADAGWLGGLLVAMGREALDATASSKVRLDVIEETACVIRFEVDAGGVKLTPVAGMQEVAESMGARLEPGPSGQLALIVPAAA